MKAIASSATRPSTIIQIHILLFEVVLSLVCVVCVGLEVCVVVVVVVVAVLALVCVGAPELLFWANAAGTVNPAEIKLSANRHALKLLNNRLFFIIRIFLSEQLE
jgi:hypothetical protein